MSPMRLLRCATFAAMCLLIADARVEAQVRPLPCSTTGQNLFVRDVMADIYFWYQYLPDADAARFDSPEEYLEHLRYQPLDSSFSYITSRAANDSFFSDSQFIGFGFSTTTAADALRVTDVFPDSPARQANLSRGDRIVEINGRTINSLVESGELGGAFGPPEIGVEAEIVVTRDATPFRARMTKRLVTIPTVTLTRTFPVNGRQVGYLVFRNFVEPSYEALDAAFAELSTQGARELILDMRYNGGGLVDVARHLAALIGGGRTEGQVFAEYFHNDKNGFRNRTLRFESKANALMLDRLLVITTRASASASELIINALRPFIPVMVIGDRTYGKPVGQYGIPFCDKVLAPVAFTLRNANGEGDFFDGFAPDCPAADGLDRQLGDALEDSLREALTLLDTGRCSPAVSTGASSTPILEVENVSGWHALLGAH